MNRQQRRKRERELAKEARQNQKAKPKVEAPVNVNLREEYERSMLRMEWQAMQAEAAGIECRIALGHKVSPFMQGCLEVYSALRLLSPRPSAGTEKSWHETSDEVLEIVIDRLREAGKTLNASGGLTDMRDPLLWSHIPGNARSIVDRAFDKIGGWMG